MALQVRPLLRAATSSCAALAAGVLVFGACSSESPAAAGGDGSAAPAPDAAVWSGVPSPWVSEVADFQGFCNWAHAPATAPGDASDGVHGAGPLTVYWNHAPPHGSTEFPVGTLIVKETNEADPTQRTVFAMAKRQPRGTGYNSSGADGWEWWSVQDEGNCSVVRLWRGPIPPATESYAGSPVGDCNGCHGGAKDNDFVWSTALELSNF
jgi:hypothetical protein